MNNAESRPALSLVGVPLDGDWEVVSLVNRPRTATGGRFSVGYRVRHKDGREAYLKALDFSAALQDPDPSRALEGMTAAYNYERDLLQTCREKHMSRIATPIADGAVTVPGFGQYGRVMYIIIELASGDIRTHRDTFKYFDLAWCLRSLHNTAVGLSQLHRAEIAHQDLKPSNVLVFPENVSKVADLGRASRRGSPSGVDELQIPGDTGYASPEQLYGYHFSSEFVRRFATDLYHLGSLVFFHFSGVSATSATRSKLVTAMGNRSYSSEFSEDVAYWEAAFHDALDDLWSDIFDVAEDLADEIVKVARCLCAPDPLKRGDPRNVRERFNQYGLERIISRFDLLAKRAEYQLR